METTIIKQDISKHFTIYFKFKINYNNILKQIKYIYKRQIKKGNTIYLKKLIQKQNWDTIFTEKKTLPY